MLIKKEVVAAAVAACLVGLSAKAQQPQGGSPFQPGVPQPASPTDTLVRGELPVAARPFAYRPALADTARFGAADARAALPALEAELRELGRFVLSNEPFGERLEACRLLHWRLARALARPESYDYTWDSLPSVSRLYPDDQSFRIFTWLLQDPSGNFSHFGLVQRRFVPAQAASNGAAPQAPRIVVIPLTDRLDRTTDIQTRMLGAQDWLGALYYKPRLTDLGQGGVLTYDGQQIRENASGKRKKFPVRYYLLLGYNGHTARDNYKLIDVISFDAADSRKVTFGAPILHFGAMPYTRAVFKYAANGHFTLNTALVQDGRKRRPMIVFDDLDTVGEDSTGQRQYGIVGRTHALDFFDQEWAGRRGIFYLRRNVVVADARMDRYDPADFERRRQERLERLKAAGMEPRPKRPAPAPAPPK